MGPGKRWLAVLLALPLALAGCSNEIDTSAAAAAAPGAEATLKAKGDLSFAVVTHGAPGDAFWTVVKNGSEQAGKDLGVKVAYQSSGEPATQSQLIDAAINQRVDGLVVSMANPDALQQSIRNAVNAGIPVVTINSGQDKSAAFGALTHIGQDEIVAGEGAGQKMKEAGVTKMLCVIQEAGNVGLEQRCQGAAKGLGGNVQNLQVEGANTAAVTSTVQAKLQADTSINGVLALGPIITGPVVQAVQAAGSSAKVATFDLSADVIRDIGAGKVLFAVDQQQFLQGYLPVQFLYLNSTNLNSVGGGKPVLTGPGYVTKDNAARVGQLAGAGTR